MLLWEKEYGIVSRDDTPHNIIQVSSGYKAMKLLQDLELLQLIRLHKEEGQATLANWVQRYKGAMSKQALTDIDDQLTELRNGWE